jgi:hypothetical protein
MDKSSSQVHLKPPSSRLEESEKNLAMEEKETGKGVCNNPLKYYCRGLEEGIKEMISPSISAPTLGGPNKQDGKYHHKQKRYSIVYLVCFFCKKRGHKDRNCWHSRR